jgi:LacI family transcriptional regulator
MNPQTRQSIRDETRHRVLNAAKALGYRPNQAARTLVTGRTGMIALWVPGSYHSVFNQVIEQVMERAHASRLHVVVVEINPLIAKSLHATGLYSAANVDGILAHDCSVIADELLQMQPDAPPVVTMGPAYSSNTDHVGVDLYDGARQAVRHLYAAGCRRIVYAGYHKDMRLTEPRYAAYVSTVKELGIAPVIVELPHGNYEDSYTGILDWMAQGNAMDGLFCWNDDAAIGANRAFADLGLRVPEDIALIGSDGIRETAYTVPTLSTMQQPFEQMCEVAWKFLMNRIAEPDHPRQASVLPMRLVQRASTMRLGQESSRRRLKPAARRAAKPALAG